MSCNKKKIFICIVLVTALLLGIISFLSLRNDQQRMDLNIEEMYSEIFSQTGEIEDVATPYSILYKDSDARDMYVSSNTVRVSSSTGFALCNNTIKDNGGICAVDNGMYRLEVNEEKMTLTNDTDFISVFLDNVSRVEKRREYRNIYGECGDVINCIEEDDKEFFIVPTFNGVLLEYTIDSSTDSYSFNLLFNGDHYFVDPAGYVQISNGDTPVIIIYSPLVSDSSGEIFTGNKLELTDKNSKVELSSIFSDNAKYPIKVSMEIDLYTEKMFFDTSVYRSLPNTNMIFNNVSIFSSDQSCTYLKFNMRSFTPDISSMLDSCVLNLYAIYVDSAIDVDIYQVNEDWCSWTMTWTDKAPFGEYVGSVHVSKAGWCSLDLTQYAKKLIDNGYADQQNKLNSSIVLKIRSDDSQGLILASADNSYAPPYFEIKYRKK